MVASLGQSEYPRGSLGVWREGALVGTHLVPTVRWLGICPANWQQSSLSGQEESSHLTLLHEA